MINVKILVLVTVLFALCSAGAEAKLYKWVDDKGETHYGEVIPPEYADKDRVRFDDKGREIKKQENKTPSKAIIKDQATIDRERRDQALLGTFSSEQEIDLARDRNLQQIDARTNGIQLRQKTVQDDLDGLQKEKEARAKAGKPEDKILQEQIDQTTAKLAKLQDELAKSQEEAAAIRARYEADKQRYRELTSQTGK